MKLWRIKWENIIFIILVSATIYSGIKLYNYTSNILVFAFVLLAVAFTLYFIASTDKIKNFRHEVLKHWN